MPEKNAQNSTYGRTLAAQLEQLRAAGCRVIRVKLPDPRFASARLGRFEKDRRSTAPASLRDVLNR
jgi:hypothetical protein